MNLLIVADKTEAKTYEAIAKTAPNTAVLGAVTRIDSDFISLLGDKYNPHAVLLDTDVTAIGTNIQAAVEEITQTYPYMRILVLTDEDDNYDYPVDCIVQGQFSNIKLKEILTSMASGNTFADTDSDDSPEDHLPHRIRLNSHELDKLSASQTSRRRFGFPLIHINPIILAGTAAGVLVLVVIVLAVMKGVSGAGQVSTLDEAATTAPFFLFDTQPPTQAMTEDYDYPTLPVEYDTTATVPTTVQPPTIAHQAEAVAAEVTIAVIQTEPHRTVSLPHILTAANLLYPTTITEDTAIQAATLSAALSSITARKRLRLTTPFNYLLRSAHRMRINLFHGAARTVPLCRSITAKSPRKKSARQRSPQPRATASRRAVRSQ